MNTKEKLIDNMCIDNVKDIQISKETKTLMLCRARLSSVYNTVSNIVNKTYNRDPEDVFDGFDDKFLEFDRKLMEVISTYVEIKSSNSNYTEM